MKVILFCVNPYAFEILYPLYKAGIQRNCEIIWYVPYNILPAFKYRNEVHYTGSISELVNFRSDVLFVPGNEVPHYLRGVKTQVFHGMAGEKKGHFRVRHYFDLYLTQGPYFTDKFRSLAQKYKNFEVVETGWSKLDTLFEKRPDLDEQKQQILSQSGCEHLVLYAPTFSPSLTSAGILKPEIRQLAETKNIFLKIKFHDLMDRSAVHEYEEYFQYTDHVEIIKESDIIDHLIISDIMISDTSSVVYEFTLLNKPVITFKSRSGHISWPNIMDPKMLLPTFHSVVESDPTREQRASIIQQYHPYADGKSSERIYEAVEKYISEHGVPERRKLSPYRRYTINSYFRHKKG
jgi:CDP-ribitol ribitolphosphotransferase